MLIISVVIATLQNVVKGTEGNAQRFVNSGAWMLVLMCILWILHIDREEKLRFRLQRLGKRIVASIFILWTLFLDWRAKSLSTIHDMYEALRLLMRTQRREERVELDEDAEAGQRVVREEDENESGERRRETMRTNA